MTRPWFLLVSLAPGCHVVDLLMETPPPPREPVHAQLSEAPGFKADCDHMEECDDKLRWFTHEEQGFTLRLVFGAGIESGPLTADLLRAQAPGAEVSFRGVLPGPNPGHFRSCSPAPDRATLRIDTLEGGRLAGEISGTLELCELVEGDIVSKAKPPEQPVVIRFDLAFPSAGALSVTPEP